MKRYIRSAIRPLSDLDWQEQEDVAKTSSDLDVLEELARTSRDSDVLELIAANPNTTPEILDFLIIDSNSDTREKIATNKNATSDVLEAIVNKELSSHCIHEWTLETAAKHPNVNVSTLYKIGTFGAEWLARGTLLEVVKHPEVTADMLKDFLQIDYRCLDEVITSPNADTTFLLELTNSSDSKICYNLAQSHKVPKEVLAKLAENDSAEVRLKVAGNSKTPRLALQKLANDKNPMVRDAAQYMLDFYVGEH